MPTRAAGSKGVRPGGFQDTKVEHEKKFEGFGVLIIDIIVRTINLEILKEAGLPFSSVLRDQPQPLPHGTHFLSLYVPFLPF